MAQTADRVVTPLRPPMAPRKPALSTCAAKEARADLIAALLVTPPYTICGDADSTDIKDVADELKGDFAAFAVYLTARIDALAHITGRDVWSLDRQRFEDLYRGAVEELLGGMEKTAEKQQAYETWRAE